MRSVPWPFTLGRSGHCLQVTHLPLIPSQPSVGGGLWGEPGFHWRHGWCHICIEALHEAAIKKRVSGGKGNTAGSSCPKFFLLPHWYRLKTFLYPLKPLQMSAMACLLLLLAAVLMEHADGRPALPPLPVKGDHVWQALTSRPGRPRVNSNKSSVFLPTDGCFVASSEVELFRVEGEAVILSFPMFSRVLQVRKIAPSSAKYTISKGNGSESAADEDKERVQQSNKQLWFLPVKASDSGEYTCTYRCALKPPWALL